MYNCSLNYDYLKARHYKIISHKGIKMTAASLNSLWSIHSSSFCFAILKLKDGPPADVTNKTTTTNCDHKKGWSNPTAFNIFIKWYGCVSLTVNDAVKIGKKIGLEIPVKSGAPFTNNNSLKLFLFICNLLSKSVIRIKCHNIKFNLWFLRIQGVE